ncbi:hypothetical protein Fot_10775 [Forsythia ovata]|uniref:Uncharacterized protein n=1 Tax=Forsythia ovata TaxID=205694 RepID=A0ABD1WLH8_9LAMI
MHTKNCPLPIATTKVITIGLEDDCLQHKLTQPIIPNNKFFGSFNICCFVCVDCSRYLYRATFAAGKEHPMPACDFKVLAFGPAFASTQLWSLWDKTPSRTL